MYSSNACSHLSWSLRTWRALVSLALAVALALALGCTTVETLDREGNALLDKVNSPAGAYSSSSQSSRRVASSGLSVAKRPKMRRRMVQDRRGYQVVIWGQSRSSSTTPGHDTTMEAKAMALARSGDYEYITLQRSWRTATNRLGKSRRIPDIIAVHRNGRIDAFEVKSDSDKESELQDG